MAKKKKSTRQKKTLQGKVRAKNAASASIQTRNYRRTNRGPYAH